MEAADSTRAGRTLHKAALTRAGSTAGSASRARRSLRSAFIPSILMFFCRFLSPPLGLFTSAWPFDRRLLPWRRMHGGISGSNDAASIAGNVYQALLLTPTVPVIFFKVFAMICFARSFCYMRILFPSFLIADWWRYESVVPQDEGTVSRRAVYACGVIPKAYSQE